MTICDSRVDKGLAASLGAWVQASTVPFKCQLRFAPGATRFREAVIDEYGRRCDPSYVSKDIFNICPRMAEIRRASTSDLRSALLRVKKHLPPANTPGLEAVLGRAGVAQSEGA